MRAALVRGIVIVSLGISAPHVLEAQRLSSQQGYVLGPISDALPFGRLWYGEPNAVSNAINYAKFSHLTRKR
jgi:hypothetical protein